MVKKPTLKRKIKLAFIGQKGIPAIFGGIETYVESIVNNLPKENYDISVYVRNWYTGKELNNYKGARLIHIPTINNKYLDTFIHTFLCSLDSIFKKFDIIHYQGIGPSFFCWIPKIFGKEIVLTIHGLPQRSIKWRFFVKIFLMFSEFIGISFADRIIVVSKELKEYFEKKYKKNFIYIPNAINLNGDSFTPKIIKEKYGLNGKDYLLYLGRITPEKRIDWILKTFKKIMEDENLKTQRRIDNLKLVIAGFKSKSDRYEAQIKNYAGNDKRIILLKWVTGEEKGELLSNTLLFISTSYMEGMPIALLEAMGYGIPCLISDISSHKEIIKDNNNGFLFNQGDFESFLSKFKEVIKLDDKALTDIGTNAKEKIKNDYCLNDKIKIIDNIYQSLLKQKEYNIRKICLVCSSGGHLFQLYLLKYFWGKYEHFWVTFNKPDAFSLLKDEKHYWVYFPTTRNIKAFFINLVIAFNILKKERPRIIISNGAGVALPFFLIGKIFRAKLIYIEVFDRIDIPTLTGRLVYHFCDEFILQWEEQKKFYPRGKVFGQIL